jgi:biotin carboxyl carrier protein
VEVERKGSVRRAKLTYLRQRIGKGATLVKEKEGRPVKAAPAPAAQAAAPAPAPAPVAAPQTATPSPAAAAPEAPAAPATTVK